MVLILLIAGYYLCIAKDSTKKVAVDDAADADGEANNAYEVDVQVDVEAAPEEGENKIYEEAQL